MKHPICFMLLMLLMLFLTPSTVDAQGIQRKVNFTVLDAQDGTPIWDFTATLMAEDSTVIKTYTAKRDTTVAFQVFNSFPFWGKGKMILRLSSVGYETLDTNFEIKSNRQGSVDLGILKMKSELQMLDEVVVTGTKIKMLLRGDTVVYNADAFKLAEGSMLDALIARFPGAELSSSGEIKVNGRKIESLLVDGKEFFSGDSKAALRNLPAYTVNKVKVFDRDGKDTEMMGRDMGDRQYVMDVRLKIEYQQSLMGNLKVGGGTDNRYVAGGMVRAARGKSALNLNMKVENVNDMVELPMGVMMSGDMIQAMTQGGSGENTSRNYGLSYSYGDFMDPFNITLSSSLSHNDSMNETWQSSQHFLTGGDTYGRSSDNVMGRNINWENNLTFFTSTKSLHVDGDITYNHSNGRSTSNSLSANFNQDPSDVVDILHKVFLHPERYREETLNMMKTASLGENSSHNFDSRLSTHIKLGGDMLKTNVSFQHAKTGNERFSLNDLRYPISDMRDFRHEYNTAPTTSNGLSTSAGYDYALGQHSIALDYDFNYQNNTNESLLYRLDRLAENDSTQLRMLPSTYDVMKSIIDDPNSYHYDSRTQKHTLSVELRWKPIENKKQLTQGAYLPTSGDLMVSISMPLIWEKRDMNYFRQKESRVDQSSLFLNPNLNISFRKSDNKGMTNMGFITYLTTSAPDMLSLIDFRDDSNPLNIRLGNPDLKNSRVWQAMGHFNRDWKKNLGLLTFDFRYMKSDNQVAYTMVYDKQTGVQTTKPININGNWSCGTSLTLGRGNDMMILGNKRKASLSYQNRLSFNFNHNVDLNSVAGQEENSKNCVNNSRWSDNAHITYQRGASTITISGSASYRHTNGSREDFQTVNAWEYSYGGSAVIELPWHFQLSTDIIQFLHRGYSASEMNTDEIIWNASITRTVIKGNLSITLKGTDLLGQMKERQFTVNEQGRTETFTNVIPRYLMLTATYRFNKMPKNAKNKPSLWT